MFPKVLHLTCKNKHQIHNKVWRFCYEKYQQIYADYTIILYDNNDIYRIIKENFPHHLKIVKQIKNGGMLADLFRYIILYLEGGVYSDMDCEPLKPLDNLFTEKYYHGDENRKNRFYIYPNNVKVVNRKWDFHTNPCNNCRLISQGRLDTYQCLSHSFISPKTTLIVGAEHSRDYDHQYISYVELQTPLDLQICQWFIIAQPRNSILKIAYLTCINNLVNYINQMKNSTIHKEDFKRIKDYKRIEEITGPKMFTKVINQQYDEESTCILPCDVFCARTTSVPVTKYSYIKHHYTGSWRRIGLFHSSAPQTKIY